ncbi:target of EGR1 protein 1-like isoform X2 [Gigantopelta aegis]|nr:target of EGR1 protein 1-like isoform X2 [Gigantopelta aegis]XP_041358985.1 target of EGR1 protein 1-like isoform X2 [Gigantopelta aegis]
MTSDFRSVPVVDVHMDNFKDVWPSLTLAIKSATFVAIDTELSGLGNKRLLNAKSIDDRYASISNVAKTRSIIALGISCFKLNSVVEQTCTPADISSDKKVTVKQWSFLAQTFNIVVLCGEDYVVEPSSLKFLISHGFDFNRQYATGLSYYRGNDRNMKPSLSVRDLFSVLLEANAPVVFHNALVDLVFLYQSFYANLPSSCTTFLADLTEMYGGGIYDTKYITEYRERLTASYLEFVFRKCQRANAYRSQEWRTEVCLEFAKYPASCVDVTQRFCGLPSVAVELGYIPNKDHLHNSLCDVFASHGWCPRDAKCHQSHDIDMIIDMEGLKMANKRRKRKRRHHRTPEESSPQADDNTNKNPVSDNCSESDTTDVQTDVQMDDCQAVSTILCDDEKENSESSVLGDHQTSSTTVTSGDGCKENVTRTNTSSSVSNSHVIDISITTDITKPDAPEPCISILCPEVKNGGKESVVEEARSGGHRAGYDAFMTGFSMAFFAAKYGKVPESCSGKIVLSDLGLEDMHNKIYLCGKDIPMSIFKSAFTKTSKDHREKFQKLRHPRVV